MFFLLRERQRRSVTARLLQLIMSGSARGDVHVTLVHVHDP